MREEFFTELYKIAEKDRNVILITGDLGYGLLDKFRKNLPKQFINAGIAEQNMISVATGLALEGKEVFVYSIANFPVLRCLEQIRNDVAYHNANVKIISAGVGFDYGALGYSHYATEDISVLRAIPNISILSPCDSFQAGLTASYVYRKKGPFYIRLSKNKVENFIVDKDKYDITKPLEIRKGRKIAIFSTGEITYKSVKVAESLVKKGVNIGLYGFCMIKPIEEKNILKLLKNYDIIITLEEHRKLGGFGSAINEIVSSTKKIQKVYNIGLIDKFCYLSGTKDYLYKINKLDEKAIENIIYKIKFARKE